MQATTGRRIPVAAPVLSDTERRHLLAALGSGYVSSIGAYVDRFEAEFAGYCGSEHAVSTSSGTSALQLLLVARGIGPGDEVLVPALTFVATANAVLHCGGKPVFVDVDPGYWGMAPELVQEKIGPRTKAIIPVHLYGHPCDMDALAELSRSRGLHLIEDAAQAHGAEYRGRRVGTIGEAAVFSFFGNKIITTGEGGMITTDDEALAQRCAFLRSHAMDPNRSYWHPEPGFNYRMTNLQAALGVAQLERIDELIARKRAIAGAYREGLADVDEISFPREMPWARGVHWMTCIVLRSGGAGDLADQLAEEGIETRPIFVSLPSLPMYEEPPEAYPVATRIAADGLSLPSGCGLTDSDLDRVVDAVRAWARRR